MTYTESQTPIEKRTRSVPEGYEAWCYLECGVPVEAVELWEWAEEVFPSWDGGAVISTPRNHVVPLPCGHDDGPVMLRKRTVASA